MADGGHLEFQDVCYTNYSKFTFNGLLDPEIYDYNFKSRLYHIYKLRY